MTEYPEGFLRHFRADVERTRPQREYVRDALRAGNDPEPDPVRSAAFTARRIAAVAPGLPTDLAEAVVGNDETQASWFLSVGAQARRAVAMVRTTVDGRIHLGSGFLISPRLFLTNFHVL
jgi:endonuclease G